MGRSEHATTATRLQHAAPVLMVCPVPDPIGRRLAWPRRIDPG